MAEQAPPEVVQNPTAEASANPSTAPVLPEKIRVHALAKMLGVTSKQVLAEAAALGTELRSAQSSLPREIATRIHATVSGVSGSEVAPSQSPPSDVTPSGAADAESAPEAAESAPETAESAPEAAAPAPEDKPAPRKRTRRKATKPAAAAEPQAGPESTSGTAPQPTAETAPTEPGSTPASLFTHTEAGGAEDSNDDAAPAAVQAPLFLQPETVAEEPAPRRRRSRRAAAAPDTADEKQAESTSGPAEATQSAQAATPSEADETTDTTESGDGTESEGGDQQRRRRRGRRGRGRGRGEQSGETTESEETDERSAESTDGATEAAQSADVTAETDAETDADTESADGEQAESDESGDGSSRRRRRRRRRKGGADSEASSDDDPPNTVVHEREPRNKARVKDEVQGISGSTRLEAKRQRRRDGRDAGRRRPPILSESEFLARREAVDRVMVVREKVGGANPAASTQVAVLEDGILVEHFVTGASSPSMVGNVYLGRVQNVLPSMEAAFVDIGRGRNGVLYAGEVNWEAAGLGGRERKIEQALRPGDQVLVQVSKDPVGHKGARLTTQISLAGRFLVYVPGGTSTGISRKLPDTERKRLKEILREIVPADAGVIIRTASEGVSEEELARDVTRLQSQWATIEEQAAKAKDGKSGSPQALYEEPDLLVKVIRDLFNEDFSKLVIEGEKAWNTVETYIKTVAPDLLPRVERHDPAPGAPDVFETHRIDEQLAKALDRKVWLPSGGTLVIDRTEAMTVVDVNTGKFTGAGGNLEETVTRNNLEAAEEIVRQMRLRDIGGMIVVDFIDMVLESNRDLVLRRLTEALGRDRTRHQVSEVTSLGLVQMTRKKLGTGLVEAFSTTCEHCHGRGIIVHTEPVEVKSVDDGRGQAKESGGRKKRGRDRGAAAEQTTNGQQDQPAQPSQPAAAVVAEASVKRAHPVALAMASHHDTPDDGAASDDRAATDARAASDDKSAAGDNGGASTTSTEAVKAEETFAVVAPVATPTASPDPEPAADEAPAAPRSRRRSRRVSREAAAPTAESAETGAVFVIPATEATDVPGADDAPGAPESSLGATKKAPKRRQAPKALKATEAVAVPQESAAQESEPSVAPQAPASGDDGEAAPPRRPRRRRAAARPAGPPVDVES